MGARSDIICLQSQSRPSLFGVAELDNVLACGGVEPGALHVIEPACREYATSANVVAQTGKAENIWCATGAGCEPVARVGSRAKTIPKSGIQRTYETLLDQAGEDAAAAMAFALGFGARSGVPVCWLGPPRDLLTRGAVPDGETAAGLRIFEEPWRARATLRLADFASSDVRVIILDVRRAERLASPLRLARKLAKQGFVAILLTADADQLMQRPDSGAGVLTARWRVAQACVTPEDGLEHHAYWQVELMRADTVRRVVVRACDRTGRMTAAPRSLEPQTGKEMMRRFARA